MKKIKWPVLTKKIVRKIGFMEASEELNMQPETIRKIIEGDHEPGVNAQAKIQCLARELKIRLT